MDPTVVGAQEVDAAEQIIRDHLKQSSQKYADLEDLRQKVFASPGVQAYLDRPSAANPSDFYYAVLKSAKNLTTATGPPIPLNKRSAQPRVLDLCMAPGGFMAHLFAFRHPEGMSATAFTSPVEAGGDAIHPGLAERPAVAVELLDITLLAEDMGINPEHGTYFNQSFLARRLPIGRSFNLVLADGTPSLAIQPGNLRREQCRLLASQIVLALSQVKAGGMIILRLRDVPNPDSVEILQHFQRFASVRLFKPHKSHGVTDFFYIVARNVSPSHSCSEWLIERWRRIWEVATFALEDDFRQHCSRTAEQAQQLCDTALPTTEMERVWTVQMEDLANLLRKAKHRASCLASKAAKSPSSDHTAASTRQAARSDEPFQLDLAVPQGDVNAVRELSSDGFCHLVLRHNVQEFRQLAEQLEVSGANDSAGILEGNESPASAFSLMRGCGQGLAGMGAFTIERSDGNEPAILDLCAAPGGILREARRINPEARVTAISPPIRNEGRRLHESVHKPSHVDHKRLDVKLLAEDMGVEHIPADRPEAHTLVPKHLADSPLFDLVLCCDDHMTKAYSSRVRQKDQACLLMARLVIGLKNLSPGGTMIVLLRKLHAPDTLGLLSRLSSFARIALYKLNKIQARKSWFFLVASEVRSDGAYAEKAIEDWKETWKIATFGTQEDFESHTARDAVWARNPLEDFDLSIIEKGRKIWKIQARALPKAMPTGHFEEQAGGGESDGEE